MANFYLEGLSSFDLCILLLEKAGPSYSNYQFFKDVMERDYEDAKIYKSILNDDILSDIRYKIQIRSLTQSNIIKNIDELIILLLKKNSMHTAIYLYAKVLNVSKKDSQIYVSKLIDLL